MVRNECDIIEFFVKINSRAFDHIYLIDHQSDDGTTDIIRNLETAGYPISLSFLTDRAYTQDKILSEKIREIARENIFDYIMPLDADEFLASNTSDVSIKATIESSMTKSETGLIPWKTYCPINDEYDACTAPLFENFRMRRAEPVQHYKVILGNEFAKNCLLSQGSHSAKSKSSLRNSCRKIASRIIEFFNEDSARRKQGNGKSPSGHNFIPLILQHVPVRSSGQIIRKVILGSHTVALKKTRFPFECYHWNEMANKIRNSNYHLVSSELTSIALRYATSNDGDELVELSDDGPRIGLKSDLIDNKDLALVEPLKSFDTYIAALVAQVTRQARPRGIRDNLRLHFTWGKAADVGRSVAFSAVRDRRYKSVSLPT